MGFNSGFKALSTVFHLWARSYGMTVPCYSRHEFFRVNSEQKWWNTCMSTFSLPYVTKVTLPPMSA